ncbi:MAG: hemolysin family protein [Spirochaetaceae bacterium]|nr:hemolysin family protein [Spirochaetaceae bacterium]
MSIFKLLGRKKENDKPMEGGVPDSEQEEMIEGIEHLSDTTVKEVMVARTDTLFLPIDAPKEELFRILVESGHSRIPVYRESMDDVVGVIYAKDVLAALVENRPVSIKTIMRKPFFVPETKLIDSLLREFKRKHVHIAIVVDEYGGTSGIVCLEDIIEEIVGNIQDEFDDETEAIIQIGPQVWICDARARLDEVSERLGIPLPVDDFDSLAGYVFELFGRVPSENEKVETPYASFIIQEMDAHRILSIRIERLAQPGDDSAEIE